jgi:hypothetical protein
MNLLGREHVPSNPIDDGLKQPHRLANPIGQCRAIELDPVPRVDLALPVERQVIAKLRHQQVCERRRCRTTARCRHRRRRSLGDRVAGLAGVFGPNVPNDLEAAWHVVQHFRHILTELRHAGAAVRADACTVGVRLMHDLLARQMIRQRLALRLRADWFWTIIRHGCGDCFSLAGLQFFELQFELLDLAADPFRRTAKLHPFAAWRSGT